YRGCDDGPRQPRADPAPRALAPEDSRRADRGGGRDRIGVRVQPGRSRCLARRDLAEGVPAAYVPESRFGLTAARGGSLRYRAGGRAVDPERLPPRVVALPDHARTRSRDARPARPSAPPGGRPAAGPRDLPLQRGALLRQRADVPGADPAYRGRRPAAALD